MLPIKSFLVSIALPLMFCGIALGSGPTTIPTMPTEQTVNLCSNAPPIKVVKWFKGSAVESFKPGQVYVVEFWATWCVPCREAMPHLTELAKKFSDKATFIGVDVWEQPDDLPDESICSGVNKFVAKMGDRMGYSVAADGSDHFMFKNWLLAAHRMNIPSTFIVGRDGKVAWIGHPLELEPVLDQVVAGKWDARGELDRLGNERKSAQRRHDLLMPVFEAIDAKDFKGALSVLDRMVGANSDMTTDSDVIYFRFECLIATDPVAAFNYLDKLYEDKVFESNPGLAYGLAQTAEKNATKLGHSDYSTLLKAMDVGRRDSKNDFKNFMFMPTYAEALFRDGQIDKAIQCQQQLIAYATPNIGHGGVDQGWVDAQTKTLEGYKSAIKDSSTTQPSAMSSDQIIKEITDAQDKLDSLLKGNAAFSDPVLRGSVSREACDLIRQIAAEVSLLNLTSKTPFDITSQLDAYLGKEAALNDADAMATIDGLLNSSQPEQAVRGGICQARMRWLQAGGDATAEALVVDDLEKLDRANPDDLSLSAMTLGFSMDAATPELKQRLIDISTKTMTATETLRKKTMAAVAAQDILLRSAIGKPVVIAGKTPAGQLFTTADWKGKVIVADFWASWCHYCVLQQPALKDVYSKYHSQGLEVVGVSNDRQLEALQKFIAAKNIPWPQLFDPVSAANDEHNEVARKLNIKGIPQLFVIDRKGIVRAILEDPVDGNGSWIGPISSETIGAEVEKLLAEPN